MLELNKPDQALLRSLVDGHSKVPLEFLHLEMGTVPLQFIHKGRRLNFHQYLLQKDSDELVRKIYTTQLNDSKAGDFCNLVSQDMNELGIHMNEDHREHTTIKVYKDLVRSKVFQAAFTFLLDQQQTHSKIRNIKYKQLELQTYLHSPIFSRKEVELLFRLRSRTVPGIKTDFSELYKPDLSCPVCGLHPDTLPALLTCPVLKAELLTTADYSQIQHDDIFSSDILKQNAVTKIYIQLLEKREKILNPDEEPGSP